jgi:osmotically-inducible protein OsmY
MGLSAPLHAVDQISDIEINDAVENEILADHAVDISGVNVRTEQGVVTLSGSVDNIMARERAETLASITNGVVAVVNRIAVKPSSSRADRQIRRDVEDALLYSPATESFQADVQVSGGKVFLSGTVGSLAEKELAGNVAKSVHGVTGLINNLSLAYDRDRTDANIRQDIDERLKWDALMGHAVISVSVDDGNVKLTGTVGSAAEVRRARQNALVTGAKSINTSGIEVKAGTGDVYRRQSDFVIKSDDDIEKAVSRALFYDPRVYSTKVTASASAGVVTLRGHVSSIGAKYSAAQDAGNTIGVRAVNNRLRVRTKPISPNSSKTRIENALARDPYMERYKIGVDVEDHAVTLSGVVDTYFEKYHAFDIALRAKGVDEVHNNLEVVHKHHPLTHNSCLYGVYPDDLYWYDYEPRRTSKSDRSIKQSYRE